MQSAIGPVVDALRRDDEYFDFGKFLSREFGGNLSSPQINDRLRHILDGTQGPSPAITIALLRYAELLEKKGRPTPRARRKQS